MPKRKKNKNRKKNIGEQILIARQNKDKLALQGSKLEEKTNSDIFFIDKKPELITFAKKKQIFKSKIPSVKKKIEPNPNVEPIIRRDNEQILTRKKRNSLNTLLQNEIKSKQIQKNFEKNQQKKYNQSSKQSSKQSILLTGFGNHNYQLKDIWGTSKNSKRKVSKTKKNYQKIRVEYFKNHKIGSKEAIKNSISYNPAYELHQNSLSSALVKLNKQHLKEEDRKEKLKLDDLRSKSAPQLQVAIEVDSKINKNLNNPINEENDYTNKTIEDPRILALRKKGKLVDSKNFSIKMTKQERNKLERKKQNRISLLKEMTEKRRMAKIDKIPEILDELKQRKIISKLKRLLKNKKKVIGRYRLKSLGGIRIPSIDLTEKITLTSELPGSLRNIKPKTNLLKDNLSTFYKRSLIEPKRPNGIRPGKAKKITYTKKSILEY
eukprot:TRINITY_DN694_c0_g1_i1.p1 TRINITY_DN694_c0_g1~~TRINITY_DN694_c0_g1_i1.p1  ORF type:complete len:459 (-),score=208.78 TRINITY_DN694_c0_g1_i1:91-1395(-)